MRALGAAMILVCASSAALGQRVPLSQHGTVSQRVAYPDIEVVYNRPVARAGAARAHVFHTRYPGERNDALRVTVAPETGAHMETLSYSFPVVGPDSTVLRLHWGTVVIPLHIRVSTTP